jgi:hypothetical protein
MAVSKGSSKLRLWLLWASLSLTLAVLSILGRERLGSEGISGDFVYMWCSAEILVEGGNPYDPKAQARIQQQFGWDKETKGLGIYSFLPYYYPPWLAFACIPLLSLGYSGAKALWFFFNAELALSSGFLVPSTVSRIPCRIPILFVPVFLPTVLSLLLGQSVILMFFMIMATWWLLENGWDRLAGITLACLTIKPQLVGLLILGVVLWTVRRRRWQFLFSFTATTVVLCVGSWFLVPWWPLELWNLTRSVPPPTEYFPWIGTTWSLLLRTGGISGVAFWLLNLPVDVGSVSLIVYSALRSTGSLRNVFSVALLSVFFVAPYARHYDFPILLIPLFVLLNDRLARVSGTVVLMALLLLPYVQFVILFQLKETYGPYFKYHGELTFFWIPLLLSALWLFSANLRFQGLVKT